MIKISKLTNRILFLSPTVQAGWEPEPFRSDFEHLGILGQGSYGVVWKGRHKKTGQIYAIKEIKKKGVKGLADLVKKEVKIMYGLNHPNIIKLFNHFEDEFSIYFVLEYAEKGQLYKTMLSTPEKHFTQAQASSYISQIVKALQYIHSLSIIHRDLKPENILIMGSGILKLSDFGWSNFLPASQNSKRQTYCGTLDYLAPQMLAPGHFHDHRVDVWSVGVLTYELVIGSGPFSIELIKKGQMTEQGVKQRIQKVKYGFEGCNVSEQCKDLISKILVRKPEDRITLEEILKHKWITKYNQTTKGEEKSIQDQLWYKKLKQEFGHILETQEQQLSTFSNQQIYSFSRPQSVLNPLTSSPSIQSSNSPRTVKQLQLRIGELQLQNKMKQDQLRKLRKQVEEHKTCTIEKEDLKNKLKESERKVEIMYGRWRQAVQRMKI